MQESLILSVEDIELTVKEKFWQKKLDKYVKPAAMKVISYGLKFATGVISGLVDVFNVELQNQGPNTFVFDISPLGVDQPMPFNLTMSKAPEMSNAKGEIILHIDADFVSDDMATYVTKDTTWADYASQE